MRRKRRRERRRKAWKSTRRVSEPNFEKTKARWTPCSTALYIDNAKGQIRLHEYLENAKNDTKINWPVEVKISNDFQKYCHELMSLVLEFKYIWHATQDELWQPGIGAGSPLKICDHHTPALSSWTQSERVQEEWNRQDAGPGSHLTGSNQMKIPYFFILKKDGTSRFFVDHRNLNKVSCTILFPLPEWQSASTSWETKRFSRHWTWTEPTLK